MELLQADLDVVVVDNLSNSSVVALERVQQITGKALAFYHQDLRENEQLNRVFEEHDIDVVIHLAGLKAVGESCELPIKYYHNNINATLTLLEVMQGHDVGQLVFSSSATVYGDPEFVPITEDHPLRTTNPYGRTKLMIEEILRDVVASQPDLFQVCILRYFNPAGAHPSGLIGESPNNVPNNLLPYISQVAIGKRNSLSIFGNDYPTADGTGVRDYIHIVDLARGHLKALQFLSDTGAAGGECCEAINLGTGNGYSVLEIIHAFEKASERQVAYQFAPRRAGDVARCYASAERATRLLKWRAEKSIDEMMRDSWQWQVKNPDGYQSN